MIMTRGALKKKLDIKKHHLLRENITRWKYVSGQEYLWMENYFLCSVTGTSGSRLGMKKREVRRRSVMWLKLGEIE